MNARSNQQIARLLLRHARLLDLAGESSFRSRAYTRAAESVIGAEESMATLANEGRLRDVPAIGPGISAAIEQILASGSFAAHDDLTKSYPESLIELTTVPGVGAKTAQRLFSELRVDTLASLEAALAAGSIREAKGLGAHVETTIRSGLELLRSRTGRTPLGIALPLAHAFMASYSGVRPEDSIYLAGSARRWDVSVGDLDFVISTSNPDHALQALNSVPMVDRVKTAAVCSTRLMIAEELEADVFLTDPDALGSTLIRATGSVRHLDRLGNIPNDVAREAEIYQRLGLPLIPPELRSGDREFDRWTEIDSLVTIGDVQGEFHAHTMWSDGTASIREMADAAAARDYAFLGITDHSHGLGIAGGLDKKRLARQRREIAATDAAHHVKVLAGAEVEVHKDGSLDFDDKTLAGLDVVVASLHSGLRQPREAITDRLIRVLENPHVDIIAHPSGRLIERREGGDFDWNRVFHAAAESGTALEINADSARLDLDPYHALQASEAGCLLTVNCDSHSPSGFSAMNFGVNMSRKAWLKPEQILNCWSPDRVLTWLASRGRRT